MYYVERCPDAYQNMSYAAGFAEEKNATEWLGGKKFAHAVSPKPKKQVSALLSDPAIELFTSPIQPPSAGALT